MLLKLPSAAELTGRKTPTMHRVGQSTRHEIFGIHGLQPPVVLKAVFKRNPVILCFKEGDLIVMEMVPEN